MKVDSMLPLGLNGCQEVFYLFNRNGYATHQQYQTAI